MVNPRSLALLNANPRLLTSPNADVLLSASTPIFHVSNEGVNTPGIITFNAILIAMEGTVTFSCTGGTLSNIVGNTCALNYETMTGDSATVVATITYRNKEYSDTVEISKVYDGESGGIGMNVGVVYAYQRSVTTPTGSPGAVEYSFPASGITNATLANNWKKTIPAGTDPLWITAASPSAVGSLDNIAANEWSAPVVLAQNGVDGVSPALMSLSSTAQSFTYNSNGVETPSNQTITFTANLINTVGTATFTCTKYDASGASLGTVVLGGTGNTRTLGVAQFTSAAFRAVVTATIGTLTDTITVVRLADGAAGAGVSAIAGYLTNESVTVPSASDGSAPVLTGVSGSFKVFQGTADVTAGCTFSLVGTPAVVTAAPTAATGAYSVTGVGSWASTSLTTSVTFRALHTASGATIDQVLTLTKAPAGVNGTSPAILTLSSTAQAFTYNGTGVATPASQTVSFTANLQNTTGTATFTCTKYDSAGASLGTVTLGGTGNTRTLTDAQFTTLAFRAVVTATLNGLTDTITVVRLSDGAAGSGVSALAGYLTNESVNVPTAPDGSGAVLTGVSGNFRVFQGTTDVTAGCTFSVVGTPLVSTTAPVSATGYYSVTGVGTWPNNSLTTSVTYRALHTASGATIDQVLTITKALAGVQGNSGINSATITIYRRTATTTVPALPSVSATYTFNPASITGLNNSWTTTIPAASNGKYLWASTATAAATTATDSIPASEWAAAQLLVQDGAKGDTGARGNVQVTRAIPGAAWSDSEAALAISGAGYGVPQNRDIVTLYNNSAAYSQQKYYDGAAWQALAAYFPGGVIVDGTVDATALKAQTITGDKIKAGAITTSSIQVSGNGDNIVPDPKFKDLTWWAQVDTGAVVTQYYTSTAWKSGATLTVSSLGVERDRETQAFPMVPGATYRVEYQVDLSPSFTGTLSVCWLIPGVQWHAMGGPDKGAWYDGLRINFDSSSPKGFQSFSATYTVPDNGTTYSTSLRIRNLLSAGSATLGGISITRVSDSTLIKDGSITTDKLVANAVTADKILAGSVGTSQLSISQGGAINSGQTAFDTGNGFWIEGAGVGHGARMSLGNSAGSKIIADPANGILALINPNINGASLDTLSATASGALGGSYPNGSSTYGTVTISASGGRTPYQYIWSLATRYKTSATSRININGGADVSATVSGTGSNCETNATLTCVVIDANQRAKVLTFDILAQHGTPP
jgi:hypothetical protein